MENLKDNTIEVEERHGFNSGLVTGLAVGAFLFWLTIKIIQIVSH